MKATVQDGHPFFLELLERPRPNTGAADLQSVGKPDAYWLKAIKDPLGKGRAVWIVPINLPTKFLPRHEAGFLHACTDACDNSLCSVFDTKFADNRAHMTFDCFCAYKHRFRHLLIAHTLA